MDRETLREKVIEMIESNFTDSVVVWRGIGLSDDEYDETERFEAMWITDEDYEKFLDFEWKLEKELAQPNGFTIMVQCLSPNATKNYRWSEYQNNRLRKYLNFYFHTTVFESQLQMHQKWNSPKWHQVDDFENLCVKNNEIYRFITHFTQSTVDADYQKDLIDLDEFFCQSKPNDPENRILGLKPQIIDNKDCNKDRFPYAA